MSNIYRTSQCHLVAEQQKAFTWELRNSVRAKLRRFITPTRIAAAVNYPNICVNEEELCEDDNMHEHGFR